MIETATLNERGGTRFDDARRAMIDSQLRTSGVTEAFVLARMGTVPREDFVPEGQRAAAYSDRAVRLPDGGFLPAPLFHGMLLAEGRPTSADRTIVVDAGSGYLAALVEPIVASMTIATPADAAAGKPGMKDATLLLIDGAIEELPAALIKALAPDARVVTGLFERGVTRLAAGRKAGGGVGLVPLSEVGVPRLPAFDREVGWTF
ncbi:protein-L-isoaspartate O-methyltransferase [Qipengyuania sp.]|uniref:protein-L-isoaspartate O-methyltransferase family protein n=1 Tax=Qipengyuania sp. TaxID=2004515 RepID=UPI0035C7FBE8